MDAFDATQKKILSKLEKLDSSSDTKASSSFMLSGSVNGKPSHSSATFGVAYHGAGVGIPVSSSDGSSAP